MDGVRDVCSAALSLRKARGLRVRLPLATLTVATPDAESLRPFTDLIADEVNVKQVVLTDDVAGYSDAGAVRWCRGCSVRASAARSSR